MAISIVTYGVPNDVDADVLEWRQALAAERGVQVDKVSKSGETLRDIIAHARAARSLGIKPAMLETQA